MASRWRCFNGRAITTFLNHILYCISGFKAPLECDIPGLSGSKMTLYVTAYLEFLSALRLNKGSDSPWRGGGVGWGSWRWRWNPVHFKKPSKDVRKSKWHISCFEHGTLQLSHTHAHTHDTKPPATAIYSYTTAIWWRKDDAVITATTFSIHIFILFFMAVAQPQSPNRGEKKE